MTKIYRRQTALLALLVSTFGTPGCGDGGAPIDASTEEGDAHHPAEAGVGDAQGHREADADMPVDAGKSLPMDAKVEPADAEADAQPLDANTGANADAQTDAETDADDEHEPTSGLDARAANPTCVAWLASEAPPATLSESGCFDADDPTLPLPALIPFEPTARLWSDNANKLRWIALPDDTTIQLAEDGDGLCPPGTVLIKSFLLGDKRIETRLFVHHPAEGEGESAWAGYAYEWNADDTQAVLLSDDAYLQDGKALDAVGDPEQSWHIPSRDQCNRCHTAAANHSLGPEMAQLNAPFTYPATGRTANQLDTLQALNLFDPTTPLPAPEDRWSLSSYVGTAPVEDRARSYLHINCSGCHRPGSYAPGDLRATTPLADTGFCETDAYTFDDWPEGTKRVAPGRASHSAVSLRMRSNTESGRRMPPLGTAMVDPTGTDVVDAWLNSLEGCQ